MHVFLYKIKLFGIVYFSVCICLFFTVSSLSFFSTNHQHHLRCICRAYLIWCFFVFSFLPSPFMLKCYATISKDTWKLKVLFQFPLLCVSSCVCALYNTFKRRLILHARIKTIITHWKLNKWLYFLKRAHNTHRNIVSILKLETFVWMFVFLFFIWIMDCFALNFYFFVLFLRKPNLIVYQAFKFLHTLVVLFFFFVSSLSSSSLFYRFCYFPYSIVTFVHCLILSHTKCTY